MSVLKNLNFIAMPKSMGNEPKLRRRSRFIEQLVQQRELAKDENYVVRRQRWVKQADGSKKLVELPKRVKRWWRMDGSGNYYLILRYGNKIVAPMPDKGAIAVDDRSDLAEVLDALITAATAGELDTAIEVAKGAGNKPKRKAS